MIAHPADDDGDLDDAGEHGPIRRCVVSGERKPVECLIRFVLSPDGDVTPDLAQELPGRGVWVTADRASILRAAKGLFAKGFKGPAKAPPDLDARVEAQMTARLVALLGFARRAGEIVMGFAKVEAALRDPAPKVDCLILASGGGPSDRRKLLQMAARLTPQPRILGILSSEEISLAFGRENVVHAALERGGLAARVRVEADRLSGFRALVPSDWGPE